MRSLTILYIAIMLSTHETMVDTIESMMVLLLHDFTQHVIISSHRGPDLVNETLNKRMLHSAIAGVQLLLLNLFLANALFFTTLLRTFQRLSQEWGGWVEAEKIYMLILRTLRKIYQQGLLQGHEVFVAFLSILPGSLIMTVGYWFCAVTYGHMGIRQKIHGASVGRICMDDILVNGVVSCIALLTGQRMFRMVEGILWRRLFEGGIELYKEEVATSYSKIGFMKAVTSLLIALLDVLSSACCQVIMSMEIVKRDLFGTSSMGTIVLVFLLECFFSSARLTLLVDWGKLFTSFGVVVVGGAVVYGVWRFAMEEIWRFRKIEERRERVIY